MNRLRQNSCFLSLLIAVISLGLLLIAVVLFFSAGGVCTNLLSPSPTPSPTPRAWIEGIRPIAELAMVKFRVVVEVQNERVPEDIRQHFGAKEQMLMLVYGTVKAGFDLDKMAENDLWTDGKRVQLTLPAPKILNVEPDNKRTHIVYYDKSWLVGHDITLEGETLQIADGKMRQEAIDAGILAQAEKFGKVYFENHLRSLGFTEVRVIIK